MRIKWLALALVAMMAWACSEDDETKTPEPEPEPEKKVLVVDVPAEPKLPVDKVWLIISDANGNVLDSGRLVNGKSYTFEAPTDFADDVVALTVAWSLASYPEDPGKREIYVRTYADIPFGTFQYPRKSSWPGWPPGQDPEGPVSILKITGAFARGWNMEQMLCFPEAQSLYYQYNAFPGSDAVRIDVAAGNKSALLLAHPNNLPFTYWYQVVDGDETYNISANNFLVADTKSVAVPQTDGVRYKVTGENQYGRFPYFATYQPDIHTSIEVPVPADLFQSYETSIAVRRDDATYSYTVRDVHVPDRAKIIDGTLGIIVQDKAIVVDATVESDIIILDVTSGDGGYLRWQVYAQPGKRTITPPQLPDFILLGEGETARSFITLAKRKGLQSALNESSDHQGYIDYLTNYELVGQYPKPKEFMTVENFVK